MINGHDELPPTFKLRHPADQRSLSTQGRILLVIYSAFLPRGDGSVYDGFT